MRDAAVLFLWTPEGRVRLATLREKRQRTFGAPTRFTPCCLFFRADRRWLSGKKGNAPSVLRLISLPAVAFSMQIASLSGKIRNVRCAHSNSLRSLLSVFPCGSPMALREKRQRTFGAPTRFTPCCRIFRADRFALREKRQRTFGAPTRFTPCCRIFHADRFALRENPQRSLRSLLRLRLQGREIRKNFLKTYAGLPLPVTIRRVNGQMVGFQTVTFQKPTISLKNIRLTCGDAGICARFGSGE